MAVAEDQETLKAQAAQAAAETVQELVVLLTKATQAAQLDMDLMAVTVKAIPITSAAVVVVLEQ